MSEAEKISKLLDEYLPANGVGTEREKLRMSLHYEIGELMRGYHKTERVNELKILIKWLDKEDIAREYFIYKNQGGEGISNIIKRYLNA